MAISNLLALKIGRALACVLLWVAGTSCRSEGPVGSVGSGGKTMNAESEAGANGWFVGVDLSMLEELERAGAGHFDASGTPIPDVMRYFSERGVNLVRLRLFVDPNPDFQSTHGATQDLEMVIRLAERTRDAGAEVMLALHYSDTWADPKQQHKPSAWRDLDAEALSQRLYDYTRDVLRRLGERGIRPRVVQVGNEITGGMLWPDAQITGGPDEGQQFARLRRMLLPAIRAVRDHDKDAQVAIHIHGGGHDGLVPWFFGRLLNDGSTDEQVDFDLIALSFYPTWGDDIDHLRDNLKAVAKLTDKPVVIAEIGYPHAEPTTRGPDARKVRSPMRWPESPIGQAAFLRDVRSVLTEALPSDRAVGWVWWYPEAVPTPALFIYENGRQGLFGVDGRALPAIDVLSERSTIAGQATITGRAER